MKKATFIICALWFNLVHAQFPNIMWEYEIGAPAFGSAAAADMDNDGFYEIVFATYTNDGRAHCLNAEDGSVKWIFDIGGCGDVAPIIYDMDGDGQLDVVINGSCNPTIFCLNGESGELLWSHASGGGDSPPTVADMDGDGLPEVLFGNFNGEIRILNGEDGSLVKSIQAEPSGTALQTEPSPVDVNGDGQLDIIAASYWNNDGLNTWAFDFVTGEIIWTNHVENEVADFHAYHAGAVADIDNDGMLEYVVGSFSGIVQAINVEDGSELWTANIPESNFSAISIADLDEDGVLEIVFNNNDWVTSDEKIRVLSGMDGSEEWSYPIDFSSFRGMSISDINGNGKLDLVSGHFMGMLRAVEPYSGLIWEINLREFFPSGLPWFETDHQPLIADFDHNGTLDVFAVAGYGSYPPDELNIGRAFMVEAGVGTCPEWLMFRHDISRSGYLPASEVDAACSPSSTGDEFMENKKLEIYPNPSSGNFTIKYFSEKEMVIEISLLNTLGEHISTVKKERQLSGEYKVENNLNLGLPSGLYFLQFKFGEEDFFYKKIEILK